MRKATMVAATALAALIATAGFGLSTAGAAVRQETAVATSTGPCGTMPISSVHYTHVIWVWMENHSYSTIIGASAAPYIDALAKECGLATNYQNISHPSLPNYVGGTAGLGLSGITQFILTAILRRRAVPRSRASSDRVRRGRPTRRACRRTALPQTVASTQFDTIRLRTSRR